MDMSVEKSQKPFYGIANMVAFAKEFSIFENEKIACDFHFCQVRVL
jgi:hypothetical protein